MFEIGWTEMLVIAIVMIVVVGPKDLPKMLRTFGKMTSKMRSMAGDFRKQFDEAMKEAELDDLKNLADDARKLNPASEIRKALNPMEKAAADVRAGLDAAMKPNKAAPGEPASEVAQAAEPLKAGAAAMPGADEAAKAASGNGAAPTTSAQAAARGKAASTAKAASVAKPGASAKTPKSAGAAAKPVKATAAKPAAKKTAAAKPGKAKSGGAAK
ncbi:Sec-independent protein translocase protein TatB [Aquamicrobium sp. LC103]|uniref:Sec-independent protein translocase protein TatB n=1 Tax=Aquamicrobium sp. LC103 TaxID=1120658 RepID=UPI00063ECA04|nr:Sec-independent protein translocase protein TatB [Aquamicrobium sp. LC103]TKT76769.1 twin-arginine translocase subunit TatB [Aquamicrobium sp. LC103]